jgi:hypothetical protein
LRAPRWHRTVISLIWYVGMQARRILAGEQKKVFQVKSFFPDLNYATSGTS